MHSLSWTFFYIIGLSSSWLCHKHSSLSCACWTTTTFEFYFVTFHSAGGKHRLHRTGSPVDGSLHAHWNGEIISLQIFTEFVKRRENTQGRWWRFVAEWRSVVWKDGWSDVSESLEAIWALWWTFNVSFLNEYVLRTRDLWFTWLAVFLQLYRAEQWVWKTGELVCSNSLGIVCNREPLSYIL